MAESDISESWSDDSVEDEIRAAIFDAELRERRERFEHRRANGEWCRCTNCFPPSAPQSAFDLTCCKECTRIDEILHENDLFSKDRAYMCVTEHPAFFFYCLYRRGLEGKMHVYTSSNYDGRRLTYNARLRYVAYRSFSHWVHGRLGRGVRQPIPQCVTKRIQQEFPAQSPDEYTGYREAELDM